MSFEFGEHVCFVPLSLVSSLQMLPRSVSSISALTISLASLSALSLSVLLISVGRPCSRFAFLVYAISLLVYVVLGCCYRTAFPFPRDFVVLGLGSWCLLGKVSSKLCFKVP
ncbi:9802_t:CDS:2 [Gigaspora rosea]|nr:9802_t:CDS:2 [Gigaspora rosea]